jgi:hypothetical protein
MEFQYRAIRSKQTSSDKWLVQFTARATEIDWWAGMPQKKKFAENAETTGFQREVNKGRLIPPRR